MRAYANTLYKDYRATWYLLIYCRHGFVYKEARGTIPEEYKND
jgi:hypothetical protein